MTRRQRKAIGLESMARRVVIRIDNRLRFWKPISEARAFLHVCLYWLGYAWRRRSAMPGRARHLFRAARYARTPILRRLIGRTLTPWVAAETSRRRHRVDAQAAVSTTRRDPVRAVLLLKAPGANGEKGVVLAGTESSWPTLARVARATPRFLEHYDLVALSAWSPPKYSKLAEFVGVSADPIRVGISNADDEQAYGLLAPAILPLPLMASDWLRPRDFVPRPSSERDIDIVMVANWGRYKRHWLLFEALRSMPTNLTVVLIGGNNGTRTVEDVQAEARWFGVRQDLVFLRNLPVQDVHDYQARARVSLIFSGREGACTAVTESLFADTPVGLFHDAHVGSRAHINAATGVLLTRKGTARQLLEFLERRDRFAARQWAIENISCHRSSSRLNDILRHDALSAGRSWTANIAPFYREFFVPRYIHPESAESLRPAIIELRRSFGLDLLFPE